MRREKNPTSRLPPIRIGITIGDPCGIGPAITIKAASCLKNAAEFIIIGDKFALQQSLPAQARALKCRIYDLNNVAQGTLESAKPSRDSGRASIEYLEKSLELIKKNEIDCLVTCPISKEAVNLAGFNYSGHTEFLAEKTGSEFTVMMLLNDKLKFSLASRHIPLEKVPVYITADKLTGVIRETFSGLKRYFGLKNPRLVVCGLNPHASDNGLLGAEENTVIKPCIEKLNSSLGLAIAGPLSADVAIYRLLKREFAAAIAMYHDQALIALKLTGFGSGVNLTLGLPFVRTSPLHGTAFDLAKHPEKADPAPLIQAIKTALQCTRNLKNF